MSDTHKGPGPMADHSHADHGHVPGTMDITQQEKTFVGFIRMVTWGAVIIFCVLIFLALANA
ncbi:aa3-type cytochrome c oxidase subunit IV [Cereibacter sphaeroides]|uniref:aa3-type cytochrome c oxidase subunit IV n=1 Tax=Rhodobacterales TaxID=204455 RepID=UPI000BBE63B7|nr:MULTISPECIES: aa3-type cytochrome c oxidase subunit IV [Paracoccaceae]MCE6950486.1 aa3-type cytochrome c oxidase subunit IV [Cereibacter sphaeroides]MCE6959481.1 aa3-type cytochrome c oxidase subunit IV [Cereibacter sphaeroides]MCE6968246.1 aa3-type cytochrome c oxidase subunit IV [Cereibacter sphaeroides]MCE6973748.1 aa3-type cytochrome c oxidase subunit IV [Cereibacter sphaeroides]